MSVQTEIETKLTEALQPVYLDVINESSNHNVPPGSESHFKVVIASQAFDGKMLVARHRIINEILAEELQHKIHALALHTYTPQEWEEVSGQAPASPPCLGGGKG
ncbi:MAG: BolA/IbaG family iron-sulfur metabolism protein [Thiohalomonadales bacterium]|nr:BolA/IbaG family iron-sulfur metabolism protein [Thiohalomonadales bacterium]